MTDVPASVAALYGAGTESIKRYVDILLTTGTDWGLLGPRESERIWRRHILNSAAIAPLVPVDSSVVDVGSGAGLPGIPLALLRTDLRVTLLEPLLRRSTFLTHSVDDLGITDRVRVVRGRAEDHRDRYDVVASRALAPLPKLIGWCRPLLSPGGSILALKGSSAAGEVTAAEEDLRRLGLRAEVVTMAAGDSGEHATVVRITSRLP